MRGGNLYTSITASPIIVVRFERLGGEKSMFPRDLRPLDQKRVIRALTYNLFHDHHGNHVISALLYLGWYSSLYDHRHYPSRA